MRADEPASAARTRFPHVLRPATAAADAPVEVMSFFPAPPASAAVQPALDDLPVMVAIPLHTAARAKTPFPRMFDVARPATTRALAPVPSVSSEAMQVHGSN